MFLLKAVLLCLGGVITAIYFYFKHQFRYWKKRGFPYSEPSIPYGSIPGMGSTVSFGQSVSEIYKAFPNEKYVGFWIFFGPRLLVRDPELIKHILVRDFLSFRDRGMYVNEKDDPLSAHLFSIEGNHQWRNMRVKMSPTFTSGKMKMMLPILIKCSKRFKAVLSEPAERQEVIETKDYSARFTTDIISLAAFGIDTDCLHNKEAEFRQYGRLVFEKRAIDVIKTFAQGLMPRLGNILKITNYRKDVADFFLNAFRESMEYREKNNIRRNDFMDLLIQLKNKGRLEDVDGDETEESGISFTFYEAAAQAMVFFLAGFETSSTAMTFALYELAKDSEVQDRLRKEILEVLKKHDGNITYEAINEMAYLSRVADETLRFHPPGPFLMRQCTKDFAIPGTNLVIPKGIKVFVDVLGLHHDPKCYPNPEKFDPDRFIKENKAQRHHYAYLPFGEGPRNCIGLRFGLMQAKVGLITLLSSYKFNIADKTPIPMVYDPKSFVLSPKEGMHLRISKVLTGNQQRLN